MSGMSEHPAPFRAQTIELFFDLVFVFTITQITHLVEHAHGAVDYLYALSVLMLVWWMYGGYIWLTNHAHTPKTMRLVLVAAMAGFLVMALAIPESNGDGRLVFGLAYLYIVALHFLAFLWQGGKPAARAMLRIVPFNIAAALLVIAAGMIEADWSWILLLAPALLYVVVTIANTGDGFALDAGHFVERHGLLLIIVLGEIIIAVGSGFGGLPHDLSAFAMLLLAVALVATLWWSYFDRDDALAEHRMLQADNRKRTRIALFGYNGAHLFMIAGLILVAAGLKVGTVSLAAYTGGHGADAAHGSDAILLWGLALYLLADAAFRAIAGLGPLVLRLLGAIVFGALAAFVHGIHGTPLVALALGILLLLLVVETILSRGKSAIA
ncbi:low temperature requirement protein A [Ciceribacter sp. L1K22]|uniref:low temperature requirement protein A n=1 Tax=Ciceribacter sp. L1K22 TaxID=2820275 RepID=UPI001ABDF749|nr:low temperature requirement protein A [Ciceribacter sp. L1K22]MBO3759543.1 low temperature requirement protein A [Ciceribacter sp. L1K22]